MSRFFIDGTAALPLRSGVPPVARPSLRLVSGPPAGGGRVGVASAPRLRLTQRGRLVAVIVGALLAATLCIAFGLMPAAATSGAEPVAGLSGASAVGPTLVVQPGESLWSIATRIAPGVDPRVTVQQLVDRNGLAGTALEAGQVLRLP
jgi:LysM repeat protein